MVLGVSYRKNNGFVIQNDSMILKSRVVQVPRIAKHIYDKMLRRCLSLSFVETVLLLIPYIEDFCYLLDPVQDSSLDIEKPFDWPARVYNFFSNSIGLGGLI